MPRSFEDPLLRRIDRQGSINMPGMYYTDNEEFNRKVVDIWNKVRPRYSQFLPNPEGTGGVSYSLAELKADQELIMKIRQGPDFQRERSEAAVGLEYVIMEAIHEHGWLGTEASVTATNDYDDYVNGVDCVVSIPRKEGGYFHLGIDSTVSQDVFVIDKKLMRLVKQSRSGELNPVKYFINDQTGEREMIHVPRFVVATSANISHELQNMLIKQPDMIATDVAQHEILEEIEEQAIFAIEQLTRYKHTQTDAYRAYAEVLAYVRVLRQEKTLSVSGSYERVPIEIISDSLRRLSKMTKK
jgi:hypothetical protein